ncbi:lipase family protein [Nocardioides lacusdianchii]|uniref:lipase family protein n=1 Tax=Nocardioides lacusdianchii TaxID=2783664 RepID=UPI0027E1D486|nr:lipase family protein [Nocardioides lacusdianchii]
MTRSPRPTHDAFYTSGPVPSDPGVPVRHRRVSLPTTVGIKAWQVVHSTIGTTGRPVAVSGTILVPEMPWPVGPRPVVSFGVGVHGLHRDAAPSHLLREGRESELPLIELALRRGWAVAVTDGEGLGMPGPHTYGAGGVGGRAMLDVVRAAREAPVGLDRSAPVALWGYSEGGRCAVFAAEQHSTYAPDVPLVAVAAGGVPADLRAVAKAIDGGPFSGLNLAVLVGLATAHERPELWEILTDAGKEVARRAAGLDVVGLVLGHPEPLATHTTRGAPWDEPHWHALLASERAGRRSPEVPTYLYHAEHDEIVPTALTRDLARRYRRRDAQVRLVTVSAPDHLSGADAGAAGALAWLAEHLVQPGTGGGGTEVSAPPRLNDERQEGSDDHRPDRAADRRLGGPAQERVGPRRLRG